MTTGSWITRLSQMSVCVHGIWFI